MTDEARKRPIMDESRKREPTDDARERFLREITAQVPADRIAEVHLFRPMRRGATETGVAVIAAERADVPRGEPGDAAAKGDPAAHADRHTVFTARYRLTRKGAERGKWEFEVVADADAPLTTVDTVVRGVQRRTGDDDEPERLTADGVRAALDGQPWQPTT
jgi:hypothetical protein